MAKKKYPKWTLIDWDGNLALGYKCWRKSFGRGHVSVGVGKFNLIAFSFGADSENSGSGTRWNYENPPISEKEAMEHVDAINGDYYRYCQESAKRATVSRDKSNK